MAMPQAWFKFYRPFILNCYFKGTTLTEVFSGLINMSDHYIANSFQSTIVVKVGTSSIVSDRTNELLLPTMNLIVEAVLKLRLQGHHVVLLSSGAVDVLYENTGTAFKVTGI